MQASRPTPLFVAAIPRRFSGRIPGDTIIQKRISSYTVFTVKIHLSILPPEIFSHRSPRADRDAAVSERLQEHRSDTGIGRCKFAIIAEVGVAPEQGLDRSGFAAAIAGDEVIDLFFPP